MSFNQFSWNNYKQTEGFKNFCLFFAENNLVSINKFDKELYESYLSDIQVLERFKHTTLRKMESF